MNHPSISIIVPIYNAEKDLPRCLDSLVNQTFTDIEIICVIDGSPDNSLGICEKYREKDNRIIVVSQENMGVAGARNTGLANAKGEYIQFCDPDDYFEIAMCEKMYNAITKYNVDLAVSGAIVICDHISGVFCDSAWYNGKDDGLCCINDAVVRNINVYLWNKIFKKAIVDTYNIRFPEDLIYEDACFLYKYMFIAKTLFFVRDNLYVYIRHEQSIMAITEAKTPKAIDHVKILKDIKSYMVNYKLNGFYEKDIFLWIVINYIGLVIKYGITSIYAPAVEIVSNVLADISDEFIWNCPYLSLIDKHKLISLKRNEVKLYLRLELAMIRQGKIMKFFSFLLPNGSRRWKLAKKVYHGVFNNDKWNSAGTGESY